MDTNVDVGSAGRSSSAVQHQTAQTIILHGSYPYSQLRNTRCYPVKECETGVYMAWKRPKSFVKSKCNSYRISSGRKVTIEKLNGKSVLFSFVCTFIFLSLPSLIYIYIYIYFLPVYMAWKRAKSLVKSKCNWYQVSSGRFFSRQKLSPKVNIEKLKGKSVLFSFVCTFFFLSLPSFLYFFFWPVYLAWKRAKSFVQSKCNWYRVSSGRLFLARNYLQRRRFTY